MIKTRIIANKWFRSLLFLIYDICMIQICSFLALWIRFDLSTKSIPSQYISAVTSYSVILTVTTVLVFALFRLYSIMWSSAGIIELESIVAACVFDGISGGKPYELPGFAPGGPAFG